MKKRKVLKCVYVHITISPIKIRFLVQQATKYFFLFKCQFSKGEQPVSSFLLLLSLLYSFLKIARDCISLQCIYITPFKKNCIVCINYTLYMYISILKQECVLFIFQTHCLPVVSKSENTCTLQIIGSLNIFTIQVAVIILIT